MDLYTRATQLITKKGLQSSPMRGKNEEQCPHSSARVRRMLGHVTRKATFRTITLQLI